MKDICQLHKIYQKNLQILGHGMAKSEGIPLEYAKPGHS